MTSCADGHDFMEPVTGESRSWWLGERTVLFVTFCRRCGVNSLVYFPKKVSVQEQLLGEPADG